MVRSSRNLSPPCLFGEILDTFSVRFCSVLMPNVKNTGLTSALSQELGQFQIRVNALVPGYIETSMIESESTGISPGQTNAVGSCIALSFILFSRPFKVSVVTVRCVHLVISERTDASTLALNPEDLPKLSSMDPMPAILFWPHHISTGVLMLIYMQASTNRSCQSKSHLGA